MDFWSATTTTIKVGYIPYKNTFIQKYRCHKIERRLTEACSMTVQKYAFAVIEPKDAYGSLKMMVTIYGTD